MLEKENSVSADTRQYESIVQLHQPEGNTDILLYALEAQEMVGGLYAS